MTKGDFEIVERGAGAPLVLVPGVQGRCRYSRATVDALARFYRVITFSLWDERLETVSDAGAPGRGPMDVFADQVERCSIAKIERAAIVRVSFGGLVALRVAATRPSRAAALVMVSAPGPQWHLRPRHEAYAKLPWIFGPVFLAESPWRLKREVIAALPDRRARGAFVRRQLGTVLGAPVSLARLAARARRIGAYDRVVDCRLVRTPTLIVQGDPALDHVTGDGGTADYAALIEGARVVTLERTGHLGSVTRADDCARVIATFLDTTLKGAHHSAA